MNKRLFSLLILICLQTLTIKAQELAPCGERKFLVEFPRVISELWCIERPLDATEEWSFTAIAFTEDGSFYATRPHTGELLALRDTDADSLPDTVEIVAEGLRLPNGLATVGNVVYIIGDGAVYRYENGAISTIADDLPSGRGFMASAIAVKDGLIYLGIPYPCNLCEVDNELYGTVLSMDMNGENRQIVARGLRYPAGLAFYEGALWVTDTGRDNFDFRGLDEVNRIDLGGEVPHFGFPYCVALENAPDVIGDFDCANATAPVWIFRSRSNPLALESYDSTTFPWLNGSMLIVLGGSFDNSVIEGYALVAAHNLEDGRVASEVILPNDVAITANQVYVNDVNFISNSSSQTVNQRGAGIWPHRIYDVAVSPEGWIYTTVGGEGIYVLRPSDNPTEEVCRRWRECP